MSKITIDRAGRVVIPKPVRDWLRLEPGDALDIEATADEITLRPARAVATLVKEQGIWVHRSDSPMRDSIVDLIEQSREERISELTK